MKTLIALIMIVSMASCKNYRLYPGNYAKGHHFHGKAQLKRIADSLYKSGSDSCLVEKLKGKWTLICR